MVRTEKVGAALYALNTVLILARAMAYDGESGKDIAGILDVAEHLPRLLAESQDHTAQFREHLVDLTAKNIRFGLALERFDKAPPPRW